MPGALLPRCHLSGPAPRPLRHLVDAASWRAGADGDDGVLDTVEHVGHRGPGLRGRNVDLPDLLASHLVLGTEHGAPLARRDRERNSLDGDDERLGVECADAPDPCRGGEGATASDRMTKAVEMTSL